MNTGIQEKEVRRYRVGDGTVVGPGPQNRRFVWRSRRRVEWMGRHRHLRSEGRRCQESLSSSRNDVTETVVLVYQVFLTPLRIDFLLHPYPSRLHRNRFSPRRQRPVALPDKWTSSSLIYPTLRVLVHACPSVDSNRHFGVTVQTK